MSTLAPTDTDRVSLSELVLRHQRTGRPEHLEELLERLDRLLRSRVRKLISTEESFEDCYQEARIAALGAIERWTPDGGASVSTFVARSVDGAVKRYFRDVTWDLKVTRGPKDLAMRVQRFTAFFEKDHGRAPTVPELADFAGLGEDEVRTGLAALRAYRADSIDLRESPGGRLVSEQLPAVDRGPEPEEVMDVYEGLAHLSEEVRTVVYRYFFCDETQLEIAEAIGCSQMQVSRLLRRGIHRLRSREVTLT
ncbi:sigma-70 family RNA polymerase sigma factor [Euzebya sp.]|uniref:sigma-70 family RNA polymerase sigma factor n=1 Tax=Euzebya sp. TaxID=1971409 RepID=UPI003512EB91